MSVKGFVAWALSATLNCLTPHEQPQGKKIRWHLGRQNPKWGVSATVPSRQSGVATAKRAARKHKNRKR